MSGLDQYESELAAKMNSCGIPQHMRQGVSDYIMNGLEPGSFLSAVMANNLMDSAGKADDINQQALFCWAKLLYLIPRGCWGSTEVVTNWRKQGGLRGLANSENLSESQG